jgi:hypothetical protein
MCTKRESKAQKQETVEKAAGSIQREDHCVEREEDEGDDRNREERAQSLSSITTDSTCAV